MSMFPHTVTVLNKYRKNDGSYLYTPTVLVGVLYAEKKAVTKGTTGIDISDEIGVTVPFGVYANKTYLAPSEYVKLTDLTRNNYWTITKDDYIIKSELVSTDISISTITSNLSDKCKVTKVATLDFGNLKHWQVTGA